MLIVLLAETYPKVALSNPPSVSPTRMAISSVAKLRMPARGMMAMKLTMNTASGLTLTKCSAMPTGAAISSQLIVYQDGNRTERTWCMTGIGFFSTSSLLSFFASSESSECWVAVRDESACSSGMFELVFRFLVPSASILSGCPSLLTPVSSDGVCSRFSSSTTGSGDVLMLSAVAAFLWATGSE